MVFADARFETRRRRLASDIASQRLDAVLITNIVNVAYLTGFTGSNAALLLGIDRHALVATDGRYTTQIAAEVPDVEAIINRSTVSALLDRADSDTRIGFEADHVSVTQIERWKEAADGGKTLVPTSGLVENIRKVKDAGEIEALTAVANIANDAWAHLLDNQLIRAGRTERDVAADLEYAMRIRGSERTSFDTIVASGPNSAKPHHDAGDRILQTGDLVTVDFGAHKNGYNSDMTRTVAVGQADDFSREIYDVVLRAQQAGVEAAIVGTDLAEVDATCREIISDAGYGKYFVHSTGHGIGLEVHEMPSANASAEGKLEPYMTLTIEPGIYVPGRGGVRIEDTLVITPHGPKNLSDAGKELKLV